MNPEDKINLIKEKMKSYDKAVKARAAQAELKAYELHLERLKANPELLKTRSSMKRT